jgi:4-hydroxy-2-oxoglutarate aldolase
VLLNGILAPICTPFSADGEIDRAALRQNITKYNGTGLMGYVVGGSTGEAALLERNEKVRLFETARDSAAQDKVLIAGTASESVRETQALIGVAAAMGYRAALVITPHYYRGQMLRPESQITFFRTVADASVVPILIYNFPQMTGIDLHVDVVSQLADHPNIIGIKESSADIEKVASLTRGLPGSFQVLVGSSAKFHECLSLGAIGGILAIANAIPQCAQLIYDRYRKGDVEGSREAQKAIVEAAGVAPRYGIQGLKYGMDLKGYFGGPARLPLLPLDARQKSEIEELFRNTHAPTEP